MKTINIKGKEYTPVHERIIHFRGQEKYKNWSIMTEVVRYDDEAACIKAIIADENNIIKATGHAFELQTDTKSFVNKTSYLENAETSAVGRALGMLGIGIDNSFASANEVNNAQQQQGDPSLENPWLTEKQYNKILECIRAGQWPNKLFLECDSANEAFKYIDNKYRMKKQYREAIKEEIDSPFNQALQA